MGFNRIASGQRPAPAAATSAPSSCSTHLKPELANTLAGHLSFFDADCDGVVRFSETVERLQALDVPLPKATLSGGLIHAFMGDKPWAEGTWSAPLAIPLATIERHIHDSDTGLFDPDFKPERFEAEFTANDLNHDGILDTAEVDAMVEANKEGRVGNFASKGEFGMFMDVAGEDFERDGKSFRGVTKEMLRKNYEGTAFFEIAERIARARPPETVPVAVGKTDNIGA